MHVATRIKRMGIEALDQRSNTSKPGHKIYPYLLRSLPFTRPNQVGGHLQGAIGSISMHDGHHLCPHDARLHFSHRCSGLVNLATVQAGACQSRWRPSSAWKLRRHPRRDDPCLAH